MRKLLGFQLADERGANIQGDDDDPCDMASYEVMAPAVATAVIAKHPGYLLMPIYEGDFEAPVLLENPDAISHIERMKPLSSEQKTEIAEMVARFGKLDDLMQQMVCNDMGWLTHAEASKFHRMVEEVERMNEALKKEAADA